MGSWSKSFSKSLRKVEEVLENASVRARQEASVRAWGRINLCSRKPEYVGSRGGLWYVLGNASVSLNCCFIYFETECLLKI